MKLHLFILIVFLGSTLLNTYWLEFIYDPSTDDVFIDDAFPQERQRYEEAIASGEEIQLVDYTSWERRVVKTRSIWPATDKEQPVVENKAPQEVKATDDRIYPTEQKTSENTQNEIETSQENKVETDHRYNKDDYIGMKYKWHTFDKKQIFWRARIQYRCDQYVLDCRIPLEIAFHESRYRPEARHWCKRYSTKNKQVCSTAWWVFQFIDATWKSSSKKYLWQVGEKYDGDVNIQVAIQKMKNEWYSAWNASKNKRGK